MRKLMVLLAVDVGARVRRRGARGGDVRRAAVTGIPGRERRELVEAELDWHALQQGDVGLRDDGHLHRQRVVRMASDGPEHGDGHLHVLVVSFRSRRRTAGHIRARALGWVPCRRR